MDDSALIQHLIELDRCIDEHLIENICREITCTGPIDVLNFRQQVWQSLSSEDLQSLIKGFIRWGRLSGRGTGGSISPVSKLYKAYVELDPTGEKLLLDWIRHHRTNEYDPFGTLIYRDAQSIADCRLIDAERARTRAIKANQHNIRMEIEQNAALERQLHKSLNSLPPAIKRKDFKAVKAIIHRGVAPCSVPGFSSYSEFASAHGSPEIAKLLSSLGL